MTLKGYIEQPSNWVELVQNKHLIFDTDAIITIISCEAVEIFEVLERCGTTNCLIHPIYIELLNTQKSTDRALRLGLLHERQFQDLPLKGTNYEYATIIQKYLANKGCYPSVTDLYIAGIMAQYQHNNLLLITGNIRDFLHPLFRREAYITFQTAKNVKSMCILSFNHEELEDYKTKLNRSQK